MNDPTPEQAHQFALILQSGCPARQAIRYFFPELRDSALLLAQTDYWMTSKRVQSSVEALMSKKWQAMSLMERINFSLEKHYTEAAYFLYTHNYADLSNADKAKADTCRQILEAKLAGTAGKSNPLDAFLADLVAKQKLGASPTVVKH